MQNFISCFWIFLILIAILVAIFKKKKWSLYVGCLLAGLMLFLYGFTEIIEVHETVDWLHKVWGGLHIIVGILFIIASFLFFIYRKDAKRENQGVDSSNKYDT